MPPFEEYAFTDRPVKVRVCDCPGCHQAGEYRAPKNRDLADYWWFCLDHVREYNRGWDYFAGMGIDEIEIQIRRATVWERPSWPIGGWREREQHLRDSIMSEFFGGAGPEPSAPPMPKAERDALKDLELTPPVNFTSIKAQYRLLVKRHHPDANGGSAASEEKFKNINQAFAVLRKIYEMDDSD